MNSLIHPPLVAIFDFSGTLFDDLHIAYGSVQEIFRTYGLSCPTLEQYREEVSADYMKFYYNYGVPRTATGDELTEIRNKFYRANDESAKIRPDVGKTLNHLAFLRIPTVIVSAESVTNLYRQLIRWGN